MHKAEAILDAFALALAGLATTGANVRRARAWPADSYPALSVYMGEDEVVDQLSVINRDLQVLVVAYVRSSATLETTLNAIKAEVYTAIMDDYTLGGLAIDTALEIDGAPDIEAEQDLPTSRMAMRWRVTYRHSATSAEA